MSRERAVLEACDFEQLRDFLGRYLAISSEYRKLHDRWGRFGPLSPAQFVVLAVLALALVPLLLIVGRSDTALVILGLLVMLYSLSYFPYYKEVPTPKRVRLHYLEYLDKKNEYQALIQSGCDIAKTTGLLFSHAGYFYLRGKKYEIEPYQETLIEHRR